MKKSYVILAAALVILILGFSFTKSYLHSLEDDAKWNQRNAGIRAELDSLEREMMAKFGELKAFSRIETDSMEPPPDTLPAEATFPLLDSVVTKPSEKVTPAVKKSPKPAKAAADSSAKPTPDELALYRLYTQRRLSLPAVINAYNLRIAKEQIVAELGESYGITPEEVFKIVDKVYEYRRKGNVN